MSQQIVVDTSALLAILLDEPELARFMNIILESEVSFISSFSVLEASTSIFGRKGSSGRLGLDSLCEELDLEIVPFTTDQLRWARSAWVRFGKGRHSARLNLGDCCSYALAKSMGSPLLCKGGDFPQTDLELVSY